MTSVDFQYTLFNVIAIAFVVSQFAQYPARGIPALPAALATLSGLSAALYTGNKAVITNPPRLETILTPSATAGGKVAVAGSNLVVGATSVDGGDGAAQTLISLSHQTLAAPDPVPADRVEPSLVTFTVPPSTPPGTRWNVALRTNAGGRAVMYGALDVVAGLTAGSAQNRASTVQPAQSDGGGLGVPLAT